MHPIYETKQSWLKGMWDVHLSLSYEKSVLFLGTRFFVSCFCSMGNFFFPSNLFPGSGLVPSSIGEANWPFCPGQSRQTQQEEPGRKDERPQVPIFLKPKSNQSPPWVPMVAVEGSDEQRAGKAQRKQGMPWPSAWGQGWPGTESQRKCRGQPSACSSTSDPSCSSSPGQKGMVFPGQEGRRQDKHTEASSGAPKGQDGPSGRLSVCFGLAGASAQGIWPAFARTPAGRRVRKGWQAAERPGSTEAFRLCLQLKRQGPLVHQSDLERLLLQTSHGSPSPS